MPITSIGDQRPNLWDGGGAIQHALRKRGIDPGPVDGFFGPQTDSAVRSFQAMRGLTPDGILGPETALKLGLVLLGDGIGVPAPAKG
jgi:murein L,D-transpeptidase YcbB/YkuD